MKCRSCGREIPDETELCLFCGTTQATLSRRTEQEGGKKAKRRMPPAFMLPLFTVLVIIAVTAALTPFLIYNTLNEKMTEAERAYQEGNAETLSALVSQICDRYPGSPESERAKGWLYELLGISDPDAQPELVPSVMPEDEERALLERIKNRGNREILRVTGLEWSRNSGGGLDVSLRWRNMSKKEIVRAEFTMEAYDILNSPVVCAERGKSKVNGICEGEYPPNISGAAYSSDWISAWFADKAAYVRIYEIFLTYADGSTLFIPNLVVDYVVEY